MSLPAAAGAGRGPVPAGGGRRVPVPGCGGQSPHTGSTGLSWPPEGLHSAAHGHHIYGKRDVVVVLKTDPSFKAKSLDQFLVPQPYPF